MYRTASRRLTTTYSTNACARIDAPKTQTSNTPLSSACSASLNASCAEWGAASRATEPVLSTELSYNASRVRYRATGSPFSPKRRTPRGIQSSVISILAPNRSRQCRRAAQSGAIDKAAQKLIAEIDLAPPTDANAHKLAQLHPSPSVPVQPLPTGSLPTGANFTAAEVRSCLRSLSYASSPGPNGMRPSMLKALVDVPGGDDPTHNVMEELAFLINDFTNGGGSTAAQPYFCGATLFALPKPKSSTVRSIAIGLLLRRVISKLLARRVATEIGEYFLPLQYACGISGGCEAICHAVRSWAELAPDHPLLMIQVDASNAFNSIERQSILDEVTKHAPTLARWVHYAYGHDSALIYGAHTIWSRT